MGWDMYSSKKPQIYNYPFSTKQYVKSDAGYYSWALGTLWNRQEAAIKFINDTGEPVRLSRVAIKTVACDSGGKGYWAFGYKESTPCKGYGAKYTCYVRVSNDKEKTFQESKPYTNTISNISGPNYNTLGTGPEVANTARFGDPPFKGDKAMQLRYYDIIDCPVIEIGSVCYIHMRIHSFNVPSGGDLRSVNIRFALNPLEMEVEFEQSTAPYIWVFCADSKWHLKKPMYVRSLTKWADVEDQ